MDLLHQIVSAAALPFAYLFASRTPLHAAYLLSALVMAVAVWRVAGGGERLLRFLFPREVWLHPSALLDYRFFFVNRATFGFFLVPLLLSEATVATLVADGLGRLAGSGPALAPGAASVAAATIVAIAAYDFAIYLSHWLMHRVPVLWEFHKVHHSAEVLNPLSAYRMHPVDEILSGVIVAAFSGSAAGVLGWLWPAGGMELLVLGLNAVLFLHFLGGQNLRHSHVWLAYPGWLSHVLVSPAQHQIHHSRDPRHFDRNFGLVFAVWDWAFGTLYVPRGRERLQLGLPDGEHLAYGRIADLYLLPLRRLARRRAPAKADPA